MITDELQARADALPMLPLGYGELDKLTEYSGSFPTGTTIGKRWKCNIHREEPPTDEFGHAFGFPGFGSPPLWVVGEYAEIDGDAEHVRVRWWKPTLRDQRIRTDEIPSTTGNGPPRPRVEGCTCGDDGKNILACPRHDYPLPLGPEVRNRRETVLDERDILEAENLRLRARVQELETALRER